MREDTGSGAGGADADGRAGGADADDGSGADGAGRPSVTIRDVAREAQVHLSTVSRALDPRKRSMIGEATRERVLAVVDELGYRPHLVASGLRRGQTRTVGVVVPDLGNPIFAPFARGATHALGGAGYMPLVADTEDDHAVLARILRHRCCALGVLFNTPGNSLIGGGGGIAIATGASRLLGFPHFLATVVIAVAPVPAAILIADRLT